MPPIYQFDLPITTELPVAQQFDRQTDFTSQMFDPILLAPLVQRRME
jgi:hypothetical protein